MTVAEVTVQYVNDPKGRARSGTIRDTGGAYYGIDPAWKSQFNPGSTYKIEYETNGQYRNITRFKLISAGAPVSTATPAPSSDPGLAERIFVCGAINAILGNPNTQPHTMAPQDAVNMVNKWRDVYKATFGGQGIPHVKSGEPDKDMNDEIPW